MATLSHQPATPYVNITKRLQAFYAARGMWINDAPCGALASMLGQRCPWGYLGGVSFFATKDQLEALPKDIATNGPRGLSGHQIAQTLRRLREALVRSGGSPSPQMTRPIDQHHAPAPFEPLICPADGKARKAFEQHVMECLHTTIARSQESVY